MNCYEPPLDTNIYGVTPKRIISGNEVISSAVNAVSGYENTYTPATITVAIDTSSWGIDRTGETVAWCTGANCYTDYSGFDIVTSNSWTSEVLTGAVGSWQWHVEFESVPVFKATVTLTITSHIYSGAGFPTTLKWYTDEFYKVGETRNGWMTCYLGEEYIDHDLVKWYGNAIPCKVYIQSAGQIAKFDGTRWNHGYGHIQHDVDWVPYDGAPLITYRTDLDVEYFTCDVAPPSPPPCPWTTSSPTSGSIGNVVTLYVKYPSTPGGEAPTALTVSRTTPIYGRFIAGPDLDWFTGFPFTTSGTQTTYPIGGGYKTITWDYQLDSLDYSTDYRS